MQAVGNPRQRIKLIEKDSQLSIRCQCRLLAIHRSMVYYRLAGESEENHLLMKEIDRQNLIDPTAGSRRMYKYLRKQTGKRIGRKRVRRLMRLMGIEAIYPRKRTTIPGGPSGIFPYKLKGLSIVRPNQVWCADITFIPMHRGYMYLFSVMDWYSRKVLSWELSNSLETEFCLKALKRALQKYGAPEIMNTDQGCQFTSDEWIKCLQDNCIDISMDGRGRWIDNVIIERFWRTIKYEDIYLKSYENGVELERGISAFIERYNMLRPHESLGDATPEEIYSEKLAIAA
ncbi:IS3 family transposase [Desulfomarina profundi]|nr:IS3 family transposase [Desulfomarina profundi]